jgi:hypothetical protein
MYFEEIKKRPSKTENKDNCDNQRDKRDTREKRREVKQTEGKIPTMRKRRA